MSQARRTLVKPLRYLWNTRAWQEGDYAQKTDGLYTFRVIFKSDG